jgi:hypothetical protein
MTALRGYGSPSSAAILKLESVPAEPWKEGPWKDGAAVDKQRCVPIHWSGPELEGQRRSLRDASRRSDSDRGA